MLLDTGGVVLNSGVIGGGTGGAATTGNSPIGVLFQVLPAGAGGEGVALTLGGTLGNAGIILEVLVVWPDPPIGASRS